MAYGFHITGPETETLDGHALDTYTIDEVDVTDSDEWHIDDLPSLCSLVLFEAEIIEHPTAGEVTMQPRLTRHTWRNGNLLDVLIASRRSLAAIRNDSNVRLECPDNRLYGQSLPGSTVVPAIRTRITLIGGH